MIRFRFLDEVAKRLCKVHGSTLKTLVEGSIRSQLQSLPTVWCSAEQLSELGLSRKKIDLLVRRGVLEVGTDTESLPSIVTDTYFDYFDFPQKNSSWQFQSPLPVYWFGLPYQSPNELRHSTTAGCFDVIDQLLDCGRAVTGVLPALYPSPEWDGHLRQLIRMTDSAAGKIGVIGGDHRVTWSLLKAIKAEYPTRRINCVQFDAHHDLYGIAEFKDDTSVFPSNFNVDLLRSNTIERLVLGGTRDNGTDVAFAQSKGYAVECLNSIQTRLVTSEDSHWHLSIDIDVLDPSIAPDVSNPIPQGWDLDRLFGEIFACIESVQPSSFSVVEVAGGSDSTASAACRTVMEIDRCMGLVCTRTVIT